MTYHSLFYSPLAIGKHSVAVAAFLQKLISVIEQAPLPRRTPGNTKLGPLTESALLTALQAKMGDIEWLHDEKLIAEGRRDRADFYALLTLDGQPYICIIEADPTRGDAIAKKFVSRAACITDTSLIYVTLCFEGTQTGTIAESEKYMEFCSAICSRLSQGDKRVIYLGFMPSI